MKKFHILLITIFLVTSTLAISKTSFSEEVGRLVGSGSAVSVQKRGDGGDDSFVARIATMFSRIVDTLAQFAGDVRTYVSRETPRADKIEKKERAESPPPAVARAVSKELSIPNRTAQAEQRPVEPVKVGQPATPSVNLANPISPTQKVEPPVRVFETPRKQIDLSFTSPTVAVPPKRPSIDLSLATPAKIVETAPERPAVLSAPVVAAPPPRPIDPTAEPLPQRPIIQADAVAITPAAAPVQRTIIAMPTLPAIRTARTTVGTPPPLVRAREISPTLPTTPVTRLASTIPVAPTAPTTRSRITSPVDIAQPATREATVAATTDARAMTAGETVDTCHGEFESEFEGEIANVKITRDRKNVVLLAMEGRERKVYAYSICSGDFLDCSALPARASALETVCTEYKDSIQAGVVDEKPVKFVNQFDDQLIFVRKNILYVVNGSTAILAEIIPENLAREGKIKMSTEIVKVDETGSATCAECNLSFTIKDESNTDVTSLLDRPTAANPVLAPPVRYNSVQMAGTVVRGMPTLTIGLTVSEPSIDRPVKVERTISVVYQR